LENLLVVVDDLALPFGTLRLKPRGGDAGHNGLNHIETTLGTQQYNRLRFGIGNDFSQGYQSDYVLSDFTEDELKLLSQRIEAAIDIIKTFCLAGVDNAMNQYNNK